MSEGLKDRDCKSRPRKRFDGSKRSDMDISNLTRYGVCTEMVGSSPKSFPHSNGVWVKFEDVKELLQTAHNKQSTKCQHTNNSEFVENDIWYKRCNHCNKVWQC